MAKNPSSGTPTAGDADIEGLLRLAEAFDKVKASGKDASGDLKKLNDRMMLLAKEAKKSKDPVVVLTKSFTKLRAEGQDAGSAIEALAKQIEESTGVMTGSSKASLEDTIKGIKAMQADLIASGKGNTREAVMLNNKRAKLEMDSFKDQRNFMIGRAKMLQGGSEGLLSRFKGAGMGVANAAIKNGAEAAEFLGDAMGLTAGAMMAVAAVAGTLIAGFMAFVFISKRATKQLTDMTEAGDTMAGSIGELRANAVAYQREVMTAAAASGMTFDKMQQLMVVMNKEMGRSLGFGAQFAGAVANVGRTFGVANEESVKLATKIAVLSRTTSQDKAARAFTFLGMRAAEMKLPLDALVEPMTTLAELAGNAGSTLDSATNSMALMLQSVENLKTLGIKVFQNMRPGDVAKMTKEFSGFVAGIDEWQLAAMTFKDNESFQGMTERVAAMDAGGRIGAIKQMMNEYGLAGRTHSSELGMLLGAKSPSEALRIGSVAQQAAGKGMNDTQYNTLMASSIQKQLDSRKNAGEAIAFGEDPTAFIMDRMSKILESLLHIQDVISFWSGKGSSTTTMATSPTLSAKRPASMDAMRSMVSGQRSALSVPLS
jgi:hypothetical protein